MKLRVARHTTDLEKIITFYHDILGLEKLGGFTDHQNYDGVFLGFGSENWHLEFTVSNEAPIHQTDKDDLLVFYVNSQYEYDNLILKIKTAGIEQVKPKNPYWETNGVMFLDPDGFGVVISMSK